MTTRRQLVKGAVAAVVAGPFGAWAQTTARVWRIGYVAIAEKPLDALDAVFDAGMKQLGYVDGQNLRIERRAVGPGALDGAMQELVRINVDLIVAWTVPVAAAAKRATNTIPIVFVAVRAPVERGLVPSLARPGGHVTGLSTYAVEVIDPKLLEIAKELLPRLDRVAILTSSVDPPGTTDVRERAARTLGVKLAPIPFSNDQDVSHAPAAIERSRTQLLIAPDTPLLYLHRREIVRFAAAKRLPVVFAFREAVEVAG
jgi:putative tryptophan/tyrosine transport system substrate-binding protein